MEDELALLRAENAALRQQVAELTRLLAAALERIAELDAQLNQRPPSAPSPAKSAERVPSSRMLAWMSTQDPHTLDDDQLATLEQLRTIHPTITTALELGQDFATMVRQRQVVKLDGWLERAAQSRIVAFVSVAKGLRADEAAVRAGLTLEWSVKLGKVWALPHFW